MVCRVSFNYLAIFLGNTNSSGDPVSSEVLHDMFTSDSTAIKNVSTSLENCELCCITKQIINKYIL